MFSFADLPLGSETFTLIRAELVENDRDGSEYRDWDNAEEIEVTGAKVNPYQLAEKLNYEMNAEREYARTGLKFYAPAGTVALATDRIRYNGIIYLIFGHPQEWKDFEGLGSHVELTAQLKEG